MSKFLTGLAAFVFLVVAAGHAYRLYSHLSVTVGGHDVPLWMSWAGAILATVLAINLLIEIRR